MNEAPELAYIDWFHDGDGYAGDAKEYGADFGPAYIRADIHEARVKELEDQLAEVLKKIGDLDKFIERLTST